MAYPQLNSDQRKLLGTSFRPDMPLGPVIAEQIQDAGTAELLFARDNALYEAMQQRPSIIIGRRGAGKTAFLYSLTRDRVYEYVMHFRVVEQFQKVVNSVQQAAGQAIFVEKVAAIWREALLTTIFSDVCQRRKVADHPLPKTRKYLDHLGMSSTTSSHHALWQAVNSLATAGDSSGYMAVQKAAFEDALEECTRFLQQRGEAAVVLVDSLDEYPLDTLAVGRAFSGLLKCAGEFERPGQPYHIRLCLPAELIHDFMDLSTNPLKDFAKDVILHWHARELLILVAHRLLLFLELHDPEKLTTLPTARELDVSLAHRIFYAAFPANVTNGLRRTEPTLNYIMRHTQLLPRQLLYMLNDIMARGFKPNEGLGNLRNEHLVDGTTKAESRIAQEVCAAYSRRYPLLPLVLERTIPELPQTFTMGDLEQVFRKHTSKVYPKWDFHGALRMLIETGVVGVVASRTKQYIEGLFEYNVPHQLNTGYQDTLCLHPIFAGRYRAQIREPFAENLPIYPRGIDVDNLDVRTLSHGSLNP